MQEEMAQRLQNRSRSGTTSAPKITELPNKPPPVKAGPMSLQDELKKKLTKQQQPTKSGPTSPSSGPAKPPNLGELMFKKFDRDDSGAIDANEFQALCAELDYALTDQEKKIGVKMLDSSGSGKIKLSDFLKWWNRGNERWSELKLSDGDLMLRQMAAQAFQTVDTEKKGHIPKANYDKFYQTLVNAKLTSKSKESCFAELDKNGDGTISFAEFVEWLNNSGALKHK